MIGVLETKKTASIIYWTVGALVALYAVVAFIVGPAMYPDSAWGFAVSDSMARGGSFNHVVEPLPDDLTHDSSTFSSMWAPGQYLLPHVLELLGMPLGPALVVVTTVFTALGLVGWQMLYRSWGFPSFSVAIAVGLIAGTRMLALPFGIYNGGEVLLFGVAPWFLLLLERWRALTMAEAFGVVVAMAVVAFMKQSGILFVYAALAAAVVYDLWPPSIGRLRRPVIAALIAVVFAAGFYVLWLSKGVTAATGSSGSTTLVWIDLVPRFLQGWAATFFGMLSLGDLAGRTFQYHAYPILESLDTLHLIASVPALALMAYMCWRLAAAYAGYVRFVLAMSVFYIAAMAVIYASGGDLRMAERFFRPLSLVLLVGVVHAVSMSGQALRLPLSAIAAVSMVYGVGSYFMHIRQNLQYPMSAHGFRHRELSHDTIALLKKELAGPFDRKDTVVWVTAPETLLELPHVRVILTGSSKSELEHRAYKGRVGKLFVLVSADMVAAGRAAAMLKAFRDYDPERWTATSLGDATLYSQ